MLINYESICVNMKNTEEEMIGLALGGLLGAGFAGPLGALVGGIVGFFLGIQSKKWY